MRQEEIRHFRERGSWRTLLALAQEMTADAERHAGGVKLNAQLGGGTRLMLALNHRISNDIDLFIRDPQWIGFLTPRLNDRFERDLQGYEEDATCLKLPGRVTKQRQIPSRGCQVERNSSGRKTITAGRDCLGDGTAICHGG